MPDIGYKTFTFPFVSKGLAAHFALDAVPEGMYLNLTNLEQRAENAISSRLGSKLLNVAQPLTAPAVSLTRLNSPGRKARYAATEDGEVRYSPDPSTDYLQPIHWGLSGRRCSMFCSRTDGGTQPSVYIADRNYMLKHDGEAIAPRWGMIPPVAPVRLTLLDALRKLVRDFAATEPDNLSIGNASSSAYEARTNTTLTAAIAETGTQKVNVATDAQLSAGQFVVVGAGTADVERVCVMEVGYTGAQMWMKAAFTKTHQAGDSVTSQHLKVVLTAGANGQVTSHEAVDLSMLGDDTVEVADDDELVFSLALSNPGNVPQVRIWIDVGDGSFTSDLFIKAFTAPTSTQIVDETYQSALEAYNEKMYRMASGSIYERAAEQRYNDDPETPIEPIDPLSPGEFSNGANVHKLLRVKLKDFVKVGRAGQPGFSWKNVKGWCIWIDVADTGGTTAWVDDLYLQGGSGPDSTGGVGYDYRLIGYNRTTQVKSSPNPVQVVGKEVIAIRQPILVDWAHIENPNPTATHWRLYRRGGSLPSYWYLVAEVPIAETSFIDAFPDRLIQGNETLELDNDAPCTTTMSQPVDTVLNTNVAGGDYAEFRVPIEVPLYKNQWILVGNNPLKSGAAIWDDNGGTEEWVIIKQIDTFIDEKICQAYFQKPHQAGDRIQAESRPGTPMHIAALAFDRAWLAGDPDNPGRLYYSKKYRIESFAPQNWIDVGSPNDPIVGIAPFRGRLYVMTRSTFYDVIVPNSGPPVPMPTSVKHGLRATFGWCVFEGMLWYRSYDGIYIFTGGAEELATFAVDWLFTDIANGPLLPIDNSKVEDEEIEAGSNEIYLSYTDKAGARRRLIWESLHKRWRNDSLPVTAMHYEADTAQLVVGLQNRNVSIDRVGNVDEERGDPGAAIGFQLQTPYLNQELPKNAKVYNEFTLDCDTQGQDVVANLRFDCGAQPPLALGMVNANGRRQVTLKLNEGKGAEAYNVALELVGLVTKPVTFWGVSIRATVEAEWRKSLDTYWLRFSTAEWKTLKQGWFEYAAKAEVTCKVFIDGSETEAFSFTLPATSGARRATKRRFPPTEGKQYRMVWTSNDEFRAYPESHLEARFVGQNKGMQRENIAV